MKQLQNKVLQILFFLSVAWLSFWVLGPQSESLFGLIPVSEQHWLHNALEVMAAPLILFTIAVGAVYCFGRCPWFLKVPESISLAWLTARLLGYAPLLFALLAAVIFSAWWIFVVSGEDPAHSQYGLSAWFAAWFYSIYLTPLFTVVIVWLSALRKDRKIEG